jgi:hypothetical protein
MKGSRILYSSKSKSNTNSMIEDGKKSKVNIGTTASKYAETLLGTITCIIGR